MLLQKIVNRLIVFLVLGLFFYSCSSVSDQEKRYPAGELLIEASELLVQFNRHAYTIVDMRPVNEAVGGFIPGSVHIPGAGALSDPDHPVPFFLAGPKLFSEIMATNGIGNDSNLLIYDSGNSLHAARLFYALEYYGHSNVKILNGGIAAWKAAGGALADEPKVKNVAEFNTNVRDNLVCDAVYIQSQINNPGSIVFDARTPEEFSGEDQRGKHGGHIPGAVNIEWRNFVLIDEDIPYFKPREEIESLLAGVGITPDKEVIPHCHTNVRGSHAYFTLRLMGYESVRPYEGSWAEYGNLDGAPVSR